MHDVSAICLVLVLLASFSPFDMLNGRAKRSCLVVNFFSAILRERGWPFDHSFDCSFFLLCFLQKK